MTAYHAGATDLLETGRRFGVAIGLLVLFGVVAVAIMTLPDANKAQNVTALASSAFGVIGTIVAAYFGVRAANRAVDKMGKL